MTEDRTEIIRQTWEGISFLHRDQFLAGEMGPTILSYPPIERCSVHEYRTDLTNTERACPTPLEFKLYNTRDPIGMWQLRFVLCEGHLIFRQEIAA